VDGKGENKDNIVKKSRRKERRTKEMENKKQVT
jgi:hypothetical protein